jgi:hypothetical protein
MLRTYSLQSSKVRSEILKPVCKQSLWLVAEQKANQMHCLQPGLWIWSIWTCGLRNEVRNIQGNRKRYVKSTVTIKIMYTNNVPSGPSKEQPFLQNCQTETKAGQQHVGNFAF